MAKTKQCKVCRKKFEPWNSMQVACSPPCALKYARRVEKENQKKERAYNRARKDEMKSKAQRTKEAQAAFNAFIRERDYKDPCISCGKSKAEIEAGQWRTGGYWDAGHWLTRGARPEHRFNEDNCHKQCKVCNGGSGNWSHKSESVKEGYDKRLEQKIGRERMDAIKNDHEPKNYTPEELTDIKKKYRAKANELKRNRKK